MPKTSSSSLVMVEDVQRLGVVGHMVIKIEVSQFIAHLMAYVDMLSSSNNSVDKFWNNPLCNIIDGRYHKG